jgi:hypothetical protein
MDADQLNDQIIQCNAELDRELDEFERWLLTNVAEGIGDRKGFLNSLN